MVYDLLCLKKYNPVLHEMDRLPDEIVVVILSCLTLKEAVKTSLVSRRWRYLWRFTTGSFEVDCFCNCCETETPEFVRWVDQAVKLHHGPSIEKFIVRSHGICAINAESVSTWVHFAMQKDVKVFELRLSCNNFPDPHRFLSIASALKSKHFGFASLTSFKLDSANVKDEMIEYVLAICPHLKHLCLRFDTHLKNLKVVSASLKSLVLYFCSRLKTLTISAANLVSFDFVEPPDKPEAGLRFHNVPLLSELKLAGRICSSVFFLAQGHSEYSHVKHQLERLHLCVPINVIPSSLAFIQSSIRLPQLQCQSLKQLDLVLDTAGGGSLLFFVFLTMACPLLSALNVELLYYCPASEQTRIFALHGYRHVQQEITAHHHLHLKVVKLTNFACYKSDFRFALALVQISKSLQKMIIKPGSGRFQFDEISTEREARFLRVRECAKKLEANLPRGAELVLL